MVLTEDAERVLCREDVELTDWDGQMADAGPTLIENKFITAKDVLKAVARGTPIEFRRCVVREEFLLKGRVPAPLVFRQCEFRGRVDIRQASISGPVDFVSSILPYGLYLLEDHLAGPMRIEGSVLGSPLEIERSQFLGGLTVSGSRLAGGLVATGLRSPVGVQFQGSRFLGTVQLTDPEIGGSLRFGECEWQRGTLISILRGTIAGGVRFDSNGFDATWRAARSQDDITLLRLSDVTFGGPLALPSAASKGFPRIRMSRCVIPLLMLPEWRLARDLVLMPLEERRRTARANEDQGEVLQLLRRSYETQGRTRDSLAVYNAHRRVIAELLGGPTWWIRWAAEWFGTGLWWFVGVVAAFGTVLTLRATRWGLVEEQAGLLGRLYTALDLSVRAFIKGPPDSVPSSSPAFVVLRVERLLGMVFFFFLGLLINEWVKG